MLRRPLYRVEVNGVDYTSRFMPRVKGIEVSDQSGVTSDSASIVLADVDGSIRLPGEGDSLRILLGDDVAGVGLTFSGFISDVTSTGAKGGGRELNIRARGIDPKSDVRSAQGKHIDASTFADVAKRFAGIAGIEGVVVAPELAEINRPYWSMQFESFLHWGQRISREIGGTFKMQDGKAIFALANSGKSAGGAPLPTVQAVFGDNLLTWSISPVSSRARHGKVRARYYDEKRARWEEREVDVDPDSPGVLTDRFTLRDRDSAERRAQALKGRVERNGGNGTVSILGTAMAKPEATLVLTGARSGIDGSYLIDGVQHRLTKSGGYVTTCDVRRPSEEVGRDTRTPTAAPGSPAAASTSPTTTGRAAGPV